MSLQIKRCMVAYATPEAQYLWSVELPLEASVAEAVEAARRAAQQSPPGCPVPWDTAPVGVFGEPCPRSAIPCAGDRIELYRPLRQDPRERRRARVQRARKAP